MTKEIYEKKHLFVAVIDAAFFMVVLVCTLLMMILLPTAKNSAFESEWAHIALVVGFEFMGLIILILAPFSLWARYSRYIDLCIARRPAVIIGDDELKFYSSQTSISAIVGTKSEALSLIIAVSIAAFTSNLRRVGASLSGMYGSLPIMQIPSVPTIWKSRRMIC